MHREAQIDAFHEALTEPGRNLVVLQGPAGVGKTRLADAFLDAAEADGRLTARVLGSRAAAVLPLGALGPVLPHVINASTTPRELFDRTREEFTELGGGERLVLLVDDAHLLDTSSAVLLTQLIEVGAVFVVATIRDGEPAPDAVANWWRSARAIRIDLQDLDSDATADLLRNALDGDVGADTVRRFHLASGGNPLLLRELVLQALDAGRLRSDSGTWRISGPIPPSRRLVDLFATRLAALGTTARQALEQVVLCAPLGVSELTTEVGDAELDELERAGLIRVLVDGHRQQLVVAHQLYAEAVRAGLATLRRNALLLAAADRLEELGARRREDARRIATWRLDAGGTPDLAVLLQATRVARYAHDFEQVERLAEVLADVELTGEVAVLLGEAHYELGRFEQSEAVLAAPVPDDTDPALLVQRATLRTKNLQWGLCDWEQALRVVEDAETVVPPELAADLEAERGSVLMFSGRPQEALDVLDAIDHPSERAKVLIAIPRGPALAAVGRTAEAIALSAEGFEVHSAMPEPLALAHPGIHIVNQAFSLAEAGRLEEAEELAALGYEVAVADNVPIAQIWFALVIARSEAVRGRCADAVRWYHEGASTARLHGFKGPLRLALAGLAAAEAMLGHVDEATAIMEEHDQQPLFPFLGHDQILGPAWTAWAQGDPEQARKLFLEVAEQAAASCNRGAAAWLWHDAARLGARGLVPKMEALGAMSDSALVAARVAHVVALESDDPEALLAAADAFEAMGADLPAAEACLSASDALRRRGEPRPAAAAANRSQALADRCPGVRTPGLIRADATVPLSTREREIATLAASGLSSQEIADRLFLSIRTVDNHLQKAYAKLGVNKRDQLAAALS